MRDQPVDTIIAATFEVDEMAIRFGGSTTSGELRELCRLDGSYRALSGHDASSCLPIQLAAVGWESIGLHGLSHRMFMRGEWWSSIGLKRRLFAEEPRPLASACDPSEQGVCELATVNGAALRSLRDALKASANPPLVLVVGDHLPLFSDLRSGLQSARRPCLGSSSCLGDVRCGAGRVTSSQPRA